ncbi:FHA domain-containing protein, partial [Slackia exigua]|uniref:FHA domain-containing protein n=1 Tax=Slackia exigua TaxID=84109 RepID=UPI0028DB1CE0
FFAEEFLAHAREARMPGGDVARADDDIGASYVSARHARFVLMGQNLFVEDLGSTNGTAVNGQRISAPTALRNNDVINIGDVVIRARFE